MSDENCCKCGAPEDDHYTEWEDGVPFVGSYHNAPNGRICSPHMAGEKVGEYLVILPIGAAKELEQTRLQLSEAKALLQRFLDAGPEEEYEVILCKLSGDVEKFLGAQ